MSNADTQLAVQPSSKSHGIDFFDPNQFTHAQRVAQMFAQSALVPTAYQGNVGNCVIALDVAARTGSSPMMVMQNLNIIFGKPSWSSQYCIAAINSSGRYTPLRYEVTDLGEIEHNGQKMRNKQVIAYAWEKNQPELWGKKEARLESAPVSIEMAIKEGWFDRKGTKWHTMTDLMLNYRASTWFGRMYAPELLMGMQTQEEAIDVETVSVDPATEKIAGRLGLPGPTDAAPPVEKKKRSGKGASSVADQPPAVDVPTTTTPPAAEKPAEQKPAERPKPEEKPAPPAEQKQPPAQTAAAEKVPGDTPAGPTLIRCEVEEVIAHKVGERTFSKVQLSDQKEVAWWEGEPSKFPAVGTIIDVVIGRRPSKSNPAVTLPFVASYEVIGG